MSELVENYQEEQALEEAEPQDHKFATIGAIYEDGVSLIFDGEEEESQKHYKVNAFMVFEAGDRVHILKDSGTYVVICSIGNPKTAFVADTAESAVSAQRLQTARNIALTGVVTGSTSFNGTQNASITTTFPSNTKVPIANVVENQYTQYTDIYFRCQTAGVLQFSSGGSSWYTLART